MFNFEKGIYQQRNHRRDEDRRLGLVGVCNGVEMGEKGKGAFLKK